MRRLPKPRGDDRRGARRAGGARRGGAAIVGGALLLAIAAPRRPAGVDQALSLYRAYEWLFWTAAALVVATGVGNVAADGSGLPGADTTWGCALALKLLAVLVLRATLSAFGSVRDAPRELVASPRSRRE